MDISERNQAIYTLVHGGIDVEKIAKRFDISKTMVRKIYQQQASKKVNGDPDIPEIDKMCRIFQWREQDRGKLQSILHKHGYTNFNDAWIWTDTDIFKKIPEIGPKSICIIWLAQRIRRD